MDPVEQNMKEALVRLKLSNSFFRLFQTYMNTYRSHGGKTAVSQSIACSPPPPESVITYEEIMRQNRLTAGSGALEDKDSSIFDSSTDHIDKDASATSHSDNSIESVRALLRKLVIVKLDVDNAIGMGYNDPKSLLGLRPGMSFLDLAIQQVEYLKSEYGVNVPLILIASFRTQQALQEKLGQHRMINPSLQVRLIEVSHYPMIVKESMRPAPTVCFADAEAVGEEWAWYPAGNGGVYGALYRSGALKKLVEEGKERMFISAIDNLGAVVDTDILMHMARTRSDLYMEVAEKGDSSIDKAAGTLVCVNGQLQLVEQWQREKGGMFTLGSEYKAHQRWGQEHGHQRKLFNTNNLWMSISKVASLMGVATDGGSGGGGGSEGSGSGGSGGGESSGGGGGSSSSSGGGQAKHAHLSDVVPAQAVVEINRPDGQSSHITGSQVLKLETGTPGSAIRHFERPLCVHVPRYSRTPRFLPVVSTSDLLMVQAMKHTTPLYTIAPNGSMRLNPERLAVIPPIVKLGPEFATLEEYRQRVSKTMNIIDLDTLTVNGDVRFEKYVTLKGSVIVVANGGSMVVPQCSILEDKVLSGTLNIEDA